MTDIFTPPAPLQTAVLFLVFNRPDTTAQVFEAIRKAKPPRLYVAADGPRADRPGEAERVVKVREIATAVDWPCEVKTLFREENLGCKYAVSGGITWFFEHEEQGIILEDDCLPSQSFFWFCEQALESYAKESRVMCVTGTNISDGIRFSDDLWFSNYALMWGWATWRHAWKKYDRDLSTWPIKRTDGFLKKKLKFNIAQRSSWNRILDRTYQGDIDTWDYQWIYSCWINNGLTIAPAVNLIRNIGYSSDATHTKGVHPILSHLVEKETSFPLCLPEVIDVKREADQFISRHWFGVRWTNLAKSLLIKTPGFTQVNNLRKAYFQK
jgi:hypothetical protein